MRQPMLSVLLGGIVWISAVVIVRPAPTETEWAFALLLLAPLVLVPLGLSLFLSPVADRSGCARAIVLLQFPAAVLLGCAYFLPRGLAAAALSLPWLGVTALIALLGVARLRASTARSLPEVCMSAGMVYIVVGGSWAVLDRGGVRPLDFEPVIVLLTAIHFHYAGFALPVLTGLALRHTDGFLARLTGIGVVLAVPAVAVGITVTQLHAGPLLEVLAASLMAGAGALTGVLYFRLAAWSSWPPLARLIWAIAALTLTAGMVLAATYGLRTFVPLPWLDIPAMRAWHGTANAFGFALAGFLGWTLSGIVGPVSNRLEQGRLETGPTSTRQLIRE